MKKIYILAAIISTAIMVNSCYVRVNKDSLRGFTIRQTGNYVEKTIDSLEAYNAIKILLPAEINYVYSPAESKITISADESIIRYIKTDIVDGKLILDDSNRSFLSIEIDIVGPALSYIELNGSGSFNSENLLTDSDSLQIIKSGSGDVILSKINNPISACRIVSLGSGNVDLSGMETNDLSVMSSGSGDVDLADVITSDLSVISSGSGYVDLEDISANSIKVSISGSGNCKISGRTSKAELYTQGSGNIAAQELDYESIITKSNGSGSIHHKDN